LWGRLTKPVATRPVQDGAGRITVVGELRCAAEGHRERPPPTELQAEAPSDKPAASGLSSHLAGSLDESNARRAGGIRYPQPQARHLIAQGGPGEVEEEARKSPTPASSPTPPLEEQFPAKFLASSQLPGGGGEEGEGFKSRLAPLPGRNRGKDATSLQVKTRSAAKRKPWERGDQSKQDGSHLQPLLNKPTDVSWQVTTTTRHSSE